MTTRDLSLSHMFLFNIYYDGESDVLAVSQTFNITDGSENTSSTSATSPISSATSPSATNTPSTAVISAAAGPTATTDRDQRSGLSTGAKVGVGIAVAVLALGGLAAGYCLYGRRVKKQQQGVAPILDAGKSLATTEQKPSGSLAHRPHEIDSLYSHSITHELDGVATRH